MLLSPTFAADPFLYIAEAIKRSVHRVITAPGRAVGRWLARTGEAIRNLGTRIRMRGNRVQEMHRKLDDDGTSPYFTLRPQRKTGVGTLVFHDTTSLKNLARVYPGKRKSVASYPSIAIDKGQIRELRRRRGRDLHVYVDGSMIGDGFHYSWAAVFKDQLSPVTKMTGTVIDPLKISYGSTMGELTAARCAIESAILAGIPKLVIHHDYMGVNPDHSSTACSNKPDIVAYRKAVKRLSEFIEIKYKKVSHKNNPAHAHAVAAERKSVQLVDAHIRNFMAAA